MTRDERRAKCIEAQIAAFLHDLKRSQVRLILMDKDMETAAMIDEIMIATRTAMTAAFDSLHSITFVNSQCPQELINLGYSPLALERWRRMAAAADLTNPPKEKP